VEDPWSVKVAPAVFGDTSIWYDGLLDGILDCSHTYSTLLAVSWLSHPLSVLCTACISRVKTIRRLFRTNHASQR